MAKKSARKEGVPPPKCKAILLCDHTIIEAGTGKVSVIGIFERFQLPAFPGHTAPFTAFLQMTDGVGRYDVTIEVHDLQNDMVLARVTGAAIEFADRRAKVNFMIAIPPLPLQHAGGYDFVVLAGGKEIDRQQFVAQAREGHSHAEDHSPD
jgi:hypothetical protein